MYSDNEKEKANDLAPIPTGSMLAGDVENTITHDPVFGEIQKDGPNYRDVRLVSMLCPKLRKFSVQGLTYV